MPFFAHSIFFFAGKNVSLSRLPQLNAWNLKKNDNNGEKITIKKRKKGEKGTKKEIKKL